MATKPKIALKRIRAAKATGEPVDIVLGDAADGNGAAFRKGLRELQLKDCVGVQPSTTGWTGEMAPQAPKSTKSKRGRPATRLRRAGGHTPVSVKDLASPLRRRGWRTVGWRDGSNARQLSRFAALQVCAAHQDWRGSELREEEWLVIEWPRSESESVHYWLSNLPTNTTLRTPVSTATTRWRIARDYQELNQEFWLPHYEGRGWRGFHHHATLCIAALMAFSSASASGEAAAKSSARSETSLLPEGDTLRASRENAASRPGFHPSASTAAPAARCRSQRALCDTARLGVWAEKCLQGEGSGQPVRAVRVCLGIDQRVPGDLPPDGVYPLNG